jgi:hypothetical protein
MSDPMSVFRCNGFPPFIRISGAFWASHKHDNWAGLNPWVRFSEGGLGGIRLEIIPLEYVAADINSAGAWRYGLVENYGGDLSFGQHPTVAAPTTITPLTGIGLRHLGLRLASDKWRVIDDDGLDATFAVRQRGWTGGIYTHAFNQIIRRRSGPALADCSYYKCIRATDTIVLSGGTYIIGNRGEDPATLPDYWQAVTVGFVDTDCINSYIVGSFMDDPRNCVLGDYKLRVVSQAQTGVGPTVQIHLIQREQMLAPDSFAAPFVFTGDPQTYNWVFSGAIGTSTPYPENERAECVVNFLRGVGWFKNNVFNSAVQNFGISWRTMSPPFTQLRRGQIVREMQGDNTPVTLWRVNADLTIPNTSFFNSIGTPEANGMTSLGTGGDSWQDRDWPSQYSDSATISQNPPQQVMRRRFTQRVRYNNWTAATEFLSMYGLDQASSKGTVFQESVAMRCNGHVNISPVNVPATLEDHPLVDPTEDDAVIGGGTVARGIWIRSGPNPRFEWPGGAPEFIRPGEAIDVEYHDNMNDGLGLRHTLTMRFWAAVPMWFPLPDFTWWNSALSYGYRGLIHRGGWIASQRLFSIENGLVLLGHGATEAKPLLSGNYAFASGVFTPIYDDFTAQITDLRSVAQAAACIYPFQPDRLVEFESTSDRQVRWFRPLALDWCRLEWRAGATVLGTDTQYAIDNKVNPMIAVRHTLTLANRNTCG